MKRSDRRSGRLGGRQLLVAAALTLVAALVLAGCAGRQSTGASESWSGVAHQADAGAAFVGTRDGRIVEILLSTDSQGRVRPQRGAVFDVAERDEGEGNQRVGAAFYGTPTIAEGRVYVGSYQGLVYSLLASGTGEGAALSDVGSFEIEGDRLAKGITGDVVYVDGSLIFASAEDTNEGRMYVLDAQALDDNAHQSEVERCRYPAEGQNGAGRMWTTPLVMDGIAYFGDLKHNVHAVNIQNCELEWSAPTRLGGAVVSTPVAVNGKLYLGAFDRGFYEVDVATGESRLLFEARSWFWASPVLVNGLVVAPNMDGTVYAFDPAQGANGSIAWEYDQEGSEAPILAKPAVIQDRIVLGSDAGFVTLLDAEGNRLRRVGNADDQIRAPITQYEDTVYVHALDEGITAYLVLDNTIQEDWTYTIEGF